MQCGSRYASSERDKALLMVGKIAFISGLYVTTKGVPISLCCLPITDCLMLLRMVALGGITSNALTIAAMG